jgi:hypothetical protein
MISSDARALFERTIINYTGPDARGLWAAWWKFEYYFTDVVSSINLDKRLAEAYPEGRYRTFADFLALLSL